MNFIDRIRLRIADVIASSLLSVFIATFATALANTETLSGNVFSTEAYLILFSLALLPLVLTLTGFAAATIKAGPFGVIGFLFEWAGASSLFTQPQSSDMGAIVFGAIIVALGTLIWSWKPVFRYILNSRSQRRSPPITRR